MVLESAYGGTVPAFLEQTLWGPLGMEFDGSWSLDSREDAMAKMESGINARAIDFAKIGRLMLQQGNWEGRQVVSPGWIEASMQVVPENQVGKFGDDIYYQLGWWIAAPGESRSYTVFGWGHLGQYLFIYPEENMVIVRFGSKIGKVDSWRQIAQAIVDQVVLAEQE